MNENENNISEELMPEEKETQTELKEETRKDDISIIVKFYYAF